MAALDRIDRPYGSGDPDILTAGPVGSRLLGFQGGDVIRGGGSADLLFGLAGNDRIEGGNGADTLHGGSGGDALYGGGANDLLFGDPDAYLLSAGAAVAERTDALIGASSFGIVYFGSSYTLEGLAAAAHDMLIINPARTINTNVARGEELWLANEISAIEGNGKQAIGYISLAKINDFVDYWDPGWTSNGRATGVDTGAPKFLLGLDPEEHDGDFTRLADFGDAGWRALLFDRVETIIDQGFSGLFLDDLMQHYDRHPKDPAKIAEAARDMRDLVIALVDHARDKIRLESGEAAAEAFTIIVNGAPFLIANTTADNSALDAGREAAFYGSIDALLVENYVRIGDGLALAQAVQAYGARGIALLSVDTGQATPQQRAEIEEAAVAAGFLPTVTPTGNYSDLSSRFVPGANLPAAGNDLLDGGTGADQMQGRGGNDSYFVDNVGDRVVEANGAGTDTVNSSVSFSLYGQYIEKLTLTGSAAVNATGNSLANVLTGNATANILNGAAGADAMAGGKGDDIYVVDHAGDVAKELTGEGTDSVSSSVSFSLYGQYIEKLTLTGSAAVNATGNSLANILAGNAAANVLNGAAGADAMAGGKGDDVYVVDNAGDVATELSGEGTDTVNSSVSFSLYGQYIEKLTLTGSAAVNAAGNSLANILTGNSAANVLNGMTGADAMAGGKGDDTYVVDHSGDTVRELAGEGADSVRSSVSFSLAGQYIEKLILTGSAAINGTGNGHANSLTGNGAANLLDGGAAADTLSGGGGADFFLFSSALGGGNVDAILDFSVPADTIRLARSVFTQAGANGTLSAAAFRQGAAAADASDRIVYDSATGRIFYDPDGSGAAAQILFASVTAGTALTQADFVVYG